MILVNQAPLHHLFKSQLLTLIRIGPLIINFNVGLNNCWGTWEAKFSHSRQFPPMSNLCWTHFTYFIFEYSSFVLCLVCLTHPLCNCSSFQALTQLEKECHSLRKKLSQEVCGSQTDLLHTLVYTRRPSLLYLQ